MMRLYFRNVGPNLRGNVANEKKSLRHRVSLSARRSGGFTLLELIITLTVLTILTLGVMPLVKISVRRQREQRLREALREMRLAIQEFHRDTVGMTCSPTTGNATGPVAIDPRQQTPNQGQSQAGVDPRSKVVITDCTIFTIDNPDRFPPDLETLVKGVNIAPRGGGANSLGGAGLGDSKTTATEVNEEASTKKKIYLRSIPVDPVTGKAEWDLRSCYDLPDSASWGAENVFDVRSKASGTALNGEKFSDW
jgi:general secretion pathway protein G